jgi:hypothetical protein
MKKLIVLVLSLSLMSCTDQTKRQKHLQTLYPKCKVEPATGLVQGEGYDFIVIDSTLQIIAVSYYPFSETKISYLRNIR